MKTLKQHLDKIQEETEEIYWNEKSIIYAVKEWLTQKFNEIENRECKNDEEFNRDADQQTIINKLLEELNQ